MKSLYALLMRVIHIVAYPFLALLLHNTSRVRVIIIADGHILLQRSSLGSQKWSLPGGGVEKSEKMTAAAVREVKEEVGVVINEEQLEHLGEAEVETATWPLVTLSFFSVKLQKMTEPKITRPLEVLEVGWFKLSDLPINRSPTVDTGLGLLQEA